jgi:hypothetical protein
MSLAIQNRYEALVKGLVCRDGGCFSADAHDVERWFDVYPDTEQLKFSSFFGRA